MASTKSGADDLNALRNALLPVLEQAAIGYFDREILIDPANSEDVNEMLTGVNVLLDVVQEQAREISQLNSELKQARTPMGLINDLLDSTQSKKL
jgi:hypothetical protein